jgi:hypothetical protein
MQNKTLGHRNDLHQTLNKKIRYLIIMIFSLFRCGNFNIFEIRISQFEEENKTSMG